MRSHLEVRVSTDALVTAETFNGKLLALYYDIEDHYKGVRSTIVVVDGLINCDLRRGGFLTGVEVLGDVNGDWLDLDPEVPESFDRDDFAAINSAVDAWRCIKLGIDLANQSPPQMPLQPEDDLCAGPDAWTAGLLIVALVFATVSALVLAWMEGRLN